MSICGFFIQETSTSEILAEHRLDRDERETLIFFGAKSKEVYRELSVTGQMCTEYYGIEKKQTETSHPALQSPTGLPWPASHYLWDLTLSLCSPGQLLFRPPGPHEVPLSLLSSLHLLFPSACSCSASYLFYSWILSTEKLKHHLLRTAPSFRQPNAKGIFSGSSLDNF